MHKCNIEFIKRHGIDLSTFDTRVYTSGDINSILQEYEVQGKKYKTHVSIADILGIYEQRGFNLNFPEVLDSFFDEFGDGYHSRSVGLLSYDVNSLLEVLSESYKIEPIKTLELDNGKHVIFTNGMHRFMVLRLLYLHEYSKCQNVEEQENLQEKYTIPVETTQIDLVKTYCKYLINIFNPAQIMGDYFDSIKKENDYYFLNKTIGWGRTQLVVLCEEEYQDYLNSVIRLGCEYDSRYQPTGRSQLKKFNGETLCLTDEELIQYTRNIILHSKKDSEGLFDMINKYSSLRHFIESNFSELFDIEGRIVLNDKNSKSIK